MIWPLLSALGGVGMFLIGMLLLTAGLKALAGRKVREVLARFTRTPVSGAITGAMTTAVVQSSSATTVTAIGFVAAGMLTFAQALGIIFGANIGTTVTGWMVAVLGYKLDLGQVVLPVVFVGAMLQLSGRGVLVQCGQALAGFSLLFIGIEYMKEGLTAFEGLVTPADFPSDTMVGRLQLVAVGLAITIVTQSSSAGVATTLAALDAGAINLPQAGALVIGMDVGTTATALLATVGGGVMARRTGLAHVVYNCLTGMMAFALLGPFMVFAQAWAAESNGQIALVTFHTFFNTLGVVLVLPFAGPFAGLIEWLVPERGPVLARGLDPALLKEPRLASNVAIMTLDRVNRAAGQYLLRVFEEGNDASSGRTERNELDETLERLQTYVDSIQLPPSQVQVVGGLNNIFHALDHLFRLLDRCDQRERVAALSGSLRLRRLRRVLACAASVQANPDDPRVAERLLDRVHVLMHNQRKAPRNRIVAQAVAGRLDDRTALAQMDALRWLDRVAYHLWRIRVHQNAAVGAGTSEPRPE